MRPLRNPEMDDMVLLLETGQLLLTINTVGSKIHLQGPTLTVQRRNPSTQWLC